jgi:hypothetical protein
MGSEQWNDVRKLLNMADSADYEMSQHRWAQLFLIRKDPNVASINRHRMLVFEDEIPLPREISIDSYKSLKWTFLSEYYELEAQIET